MLPFHKKKDFVPLVGEIKNRPSDNPQEKSDLEHCVSELIDAIHAKDHKGAAEALKACFEMYDSEPHVEGEHMEEME